MGDKITALPSATSLDGTEVSPIVQAGTTKKVAGTILRTPIGNANGDLTGSYPSPTLAAITTAQSGVGSITSIPVISVDAKGRVTSLSSVPNTMGTVTNVTAGTGLSGGPITSTGTLSVAYGTTAGTAVQGNDARFSTIPSPSATLPFANAAAAIGTSQTYARADHVHPQGSVTLSGDISGSGTNSIVGTLATITTPQSNVGGITQIPQISIDSKGRVTNLVTVSNPQTAITGLTGDVSASGPGVVSASLSASGVTAGSYGYATTGKIPTFTVDAKGRIGSASEAVIVLPTEKTSSTLNTLQFGTKSFVFSSPSNDIPYFIGQWITIRSTTNNGWISGVVSLCTLNSVIVLVNQSSAPNSSSGYTNWTIRLGQTINYNAVNPLAGQVLAYNGNGAWLPATATATSLQGYPVSSAAPLAGQNLTWSGTEWVGQSGQSGNATSIFGIDVNISNLQEDGALVYDQATNKWIVSLPDAYSLRGTQLSSAVPTTGQALVFNGTNWSPSSDFSANAIKIQGRNVDNTLPTDGQVLAWNDAISSWKPADGAGAGSDATSLQGDAIADVIPNALEVLTWAKEPTGTGDFEWRPRPLGGNTAPTAGQGLVYNADNGWVAGDVNASKIRNQTVVTTSPNTNEALVYNGNDWAPAPVNAVQLQNQAISSSAPAAGNLFKFDGTSWAPFDGLAVPNWNTSNYYNTGDKVAYDGKIWISTTAGSANTPSTGSTYWAENIGINSGTPSNQSTPAYWLRITTPAGDGYLPIYV